MGTFCKDPFPKHTSHFGDVFVIIYIKVEICSKQNKRVFDNYHANSSSLLTGRLTFNVVQLAHNPQHQLELQLLHYLIPSLYVQLKFGAISMQATLLESPSVYTSDKSSVPG